MIRVGIVGSNYGRTVLLPAFRADARCAVTALAGSDAARTRALCDEAGVEKAHGDWRALVATKDPASARRLFVQFVPTTLEEPDPPTWDYAFLQNHPTIAQRLAMVRAFANSSRASPGGP